MGNPISGGGYGGLPALGALAGAFQGLGSAATQMLPMYYEYSHKPLMDRLAEYAKRGIIFKSVEDMLKFEQEGGQTPPQGGAAAPPTEGPRGSRLPPGYAPPQGGAAAPPAEGPRGSRLPPGYAPPPGAQGPQAPQAPGTDIGAMGENPLTAAYAKSMATPPPQASPAGGPALNAMAGAAAQSPKTRMQQIAEAQTQMGEEASTVGPGGFPTIPGPRDVAGTMVYPPFQAAAPMTMFGRGGYAEGIRAPAAVAVGAGHDATAIEVAKIRAATAMARINAVYGRGSRESQTALAAFMRTPEFMMMSAQAATGDEAAEEFVRPFYDAMTAQAGRIGAGDQTPPPRAGAGGQQAPPPPAAGGGSPLEQKAAKWDAIRQQHPDWPADRVTQEVERVLGGAGGKR